VDSERLRLDIYRRLADVKDPIEIKPIEEELVDRFGPLPDSVNSLIQVATLRATARKLGIQEMIQQGKNLRISPIKLPESKQLKMQRLYPGSMYKGATNVALIALPVPEWSPLGEKSKLRDTSLIAWSTLVLQELTGK
jgi:transcription-repair coupling factor (superfamily II helicase)